MKPRDAILEAIRARPGITLRAISRRSGTPLGTVDYHVKQLLALELIFVKDHTRYAHHFPRGTDRRDTPYYIAVQHPPRARILQHLHEAPGLTQHEIATRLKASPSSVSTNLSFLHGLGVILRRPGPSDTYAPADAARLAAALRILEAHSTGSLMEATA